jgi:hypothetical protein
MIKEEILTLLWQTDEPQLYRKLWLRGLIAATLYSIFYGFYEKAIVYSTCVAKERLIETLGEYGNWAIMYIGTFLVVGLASFDYEAKRPRIEHIIYGFFVMMMLEDACFWATAAACGENTFPLPLYEDWWDYKFVPYRLLGYMGRTNGFWPYVPKYYLIMFPPSIIFHVVSFTKSPKAARIANWVLSPMMLSIVITCAVSPPCEAHGGQTFQENMDRCAVEVNDNIYWIPMAAICFGGWILGWVSYKKFNALAYSEMSSSKQHSLQTLTLV